MAGLPSTVIVGAFDSREAAEAAQRELAERGLASAPQPTAHGGHDAHHHPDDPKILRKGGLTDLIENMFGGFVDDASHERAAQLARRGAWTLVAHGVPSEHHDAVRGILGRRGRVETLVGRAPMRAMPPALVLFGPDGMDLPQAPTDWNAGRGDNPPSIPGSLDPGRPRGLLEDATGLDPDYMGLRRNDVPGGGRR